MTVRKKIYLLLILILHFNGILFSQSSTQNLLPKILPASPEQAGFAKFGNYQVNLFTGLPDISIPLYNIKVGELSVPISISYHASGIKVNDWGSWVGLGWSLNAGGSITRKVMGKPDEEMDNYLSGQTVRQSTNIDPYTQDGIDYLRFVYLGSKDVEPDIFSYNFPGKSGKFIFNQSDNFKPVLIPYDPVQVKLINPLDFSIVNESGITYEFNTTERTDASVGGNLSSATSAWLLTKITSANQQDVINFSYTSRYGTVSNDYTDFVVVNDLVENFYNGSEQASISGYSDVNTVSANEQKLQQISFPGGKVVFEPSVIDRTDGFPGQKSLSDIKIFNYDFASQSYSLQKTIYFYQSYFINTSENDKRLRLDAISIADNQNNVIERYSFVYNTTIPLPSKTNSKAKDFWGFYNGKNNTTLVPQTQISYQASPYATATNVNIGSSVPNSRDADKDYMQAGILQSIYYPTGGHTDFTFETNQYLDGSVSKYAGGLRIKSIESYDGINPAPVLKTYKYGDNESGYGRSNYILANYYNSVTQTSKFYGYTQVDANGDPIPGTCKLLSTQKRVRTYYSPPTLEEPPFDEAPVVYGTVTEYEGDELNNTGKTVYQFTDHADVLGTTMMANKPIVSTYYMNRGQLLHKMIYKKDLSGNYIPVAETQNIYEAYPEHFYLNLGLVVFKSIILEDQSGEIFSGPQHFPECHDDSYSYIYTNYSVRTADNKLTQSTSIVYDQTDPNKTSTSVTQYLYENFAHQQVTKIINTNSKLETLTTQKTYPPDYPGVEPYATMTALNIIDKEVTNKTSNNSTQLSLLKNNYRNADNGNYLPTSIDYQLGGSPSETRALFNNYDVRGNILDMQKTNDVKASYLWGYNNLFPVAEVKNATNDEKQHSVLVDITGNAGTTLNSTTTQDIYGYYTAAATQTFTLTRSGPVTLKISYPNGIIAVNGTYVFSLDPEHLNGTFSLSQSIPCGTNTIATFNSVPPGTYTITITAKSNQSQFGLCCDIYYPSQTQQNQVTGTREVYYEGFENNEDAPTDNPAAGKRYIAGDFTVPFTKPNTKDYFIDYHYRSSGKWYPITKTYTNNMTLTEGDAIDEIRIFPKDALMATYTYEPLIGMSSQCDINNHISYYEYDNYQRLRQIRDEDKNIIKKFDYHYTGTTQTATGQCNTSNCSGNDRKCINTSCEIGRRVNTKTKLLSNGLWKCTYHYEWSDTTSSGDYTENNVYPCDL